MQRLAARAALECIKENAAYISRPPDTTISPSALSSHLCTTAKAVHAPCTCSYFSQSTARHQHFQYGLQSCTSFASLLDLAQYLRSTFRLSLRDVPAYWVINVYSDSTYIDWHRDAHPPFGALDAETKSHLTRPRLRASCMLKRRGTTLAPAVR